MANQGLWRQLLQLDGLETAQRANCQYMASPDRYIVRMLNREFVVNLFKKQVFPLGGSSAAAVSEELCILAYLINAQDLPLANKLTPAQALPGGLFFFRGPHSLPTERLEEVFGRFPERLYHAADEFDAKHCEFGDASVRLYVLPRIPLTIVTWRGDEEFPARASILYDQTAAVQLPLDALWMATNLAVKALVRAATESGWTALPQ